MDSDQIKKKVRRMAYEIFENYFDEKELILVGIRTQGELLSKLLHRDLKKIHDIKYHLGRITLNKKEPLKEAVQLDLDLDSLDGKSLILVDDVLHSGRTLAFAMKPLLEQNLSRIQVCVLINRDHKSFPVTPDYIGLSLGTTLDEHVEVSLDEKGEEIAYLI